MTPAKIYPFSIPAGGSFPLLVIGDYCKILTSSGALTLTGDSFGTLGPILAGQGVEQTPFNRLVLTDATGAENNGTILIADNKFIDDRITGEVSIIDGGKFRTLSQTAFCGAARVLAVAAQNSLASCWNPVGSGKNVIIEAFIISSSVSGLLYWGTHTATTGVLVGGYNNKKAGAAASAAQGYTGSIVGSPPGFLYNGFIANLANSPFSFKFNEPIVIPPGFGFCIQNNTVNTDLQANIEFFEEVIL